MMRAAGLLLFLAPAAAAQELEGLAQEPLEHGELESGLTYGAQDRDSLLGEIGGMAAYGAFKERLKEDTGLSYVFEYAPISQWGSSEWHVDHELNLIGQWTAFAEDNGDRGELLAWYQNGATLAGLNGSEFAAELGALSPVNGGTPFANHNILQHLAWDQHFADGSWRIVAGKITTRVTFNLNRYAVSDREDFFTPMIVNNPVAPYTARNGLGLFGQHRSEAWYASAMIRDADADSTGIDFDSLSSGNWETLAEFGLTPELENLGTGTYRLTWSHTDAIGEGASAQASGWNLALSADQDVGERLGTFLRYAHADTPLRAFESRLATGFQVKSPLAHPDDRLGVGYWSGTPTDSSLGREHGLEAFYRIQLADRVELTPDIQLIFDPALDPDENLVTVLGLRLRIVL